jgi:hypothetical protein
MPLKEDEKKESDEEILRDVEREMAKPRIAKSARRAAAVDPVREPHQPERPSSCIAVVGSKTTSV